MNRYLPILLLIINGHFLIAQDLKTETGKSRIQGRVVDSASGISLEYATISLIRLEDKKTVNGTVTDAKGAFSIQGVAQGKYRLLVESIGYASKYINGISVNGRSDNIDLKNIAVQKSQQTLQGITVTAPPKLIENKIDKLVYNAEKDITSQSGVATDILKKVPQVSVDVDGNVELAGSTSIRFLIDGKPSTAFGSNIADVLQAIPASQIKSIEVITNPGAKYDAQGLGGIINIILKKSNKQGINSNLSLSLGTRQENGSFNFNAHKNKVGINAFFSGNARLNSTTPFSANRQSYDSTNNTYVLIQQDGSSEFRRHGFQTGIGFDAALSDHNNISGSVSYNNFGNNSHGLINQYQSISNAGDPAELISEITTANQAQNSFSDRNIDANLNYKRTFKKEDQELEFNINTSFGNNQNTAGNNQYLQPEDSLIYGTDGKNKARENIQEYTADYTHPFGKKVKLGVGAKWSVYDINSASDIYSFQNTGKEFLYDSSLSISLKYRQNVYAVYSELSFPVSNWFTAKIGGRLERTTINSWYSNADPQVEVEPYNTFVPSAFLTRPLGEKQTLRLSYSKRIERPDYGELNPFINTSDPHNISMGNPNLSPEIGNRVELSYNRELPRGGSLMISAFHRMNKDDIQPFITYYPSFIVGDSTYYNVYVTTRANIGIEKNTGISLFTDLHPTTKLSVRINLFAFYRHTINKIDSGYNSNSFNYRTNLNLTYQLSNTLVAEAFGNFNSARHEAQGKYPSFTYYSVAIRKQFWKKNGSLALIANNMFSEYVTQKTELFGPNFKATTTRKIPFRSISLNFTWKFGKLEFKKDKEDTNPTPNPE